MAFDTTAATNPQIVQREGFIYLSWTTASPPGTVFQVYLDLSLAWAGRATRCVIPVPPGTGNHQIDIGAVGPGETRTSWSGSLPGTLPPPRAKLTWNGGRYQSPNLEQFRIYSGTVPGGAVSYVKPVGYVTAFPQNRPIDGYGTAGYGAGGYGYSALKYTWTSPPLLSGVWNFAIVGVDKAGNATGTPSTVAVTVATSPQPPAANALGRRLAYTYNPTGRTATISWLPSPG